MSVLEMNLGHQEPRSAVKRKGWICRRHGAFKLFSLNGL